MRTAHAHVRAFVYGPSTVLPRLLTGPPGPHVTLGAWTNCSQLVCLSDWDVV